MRTGQNIYKRRDGRWEARVFLGKKANGRPNFKYLYASTYREVLFQKNNYEKTISLKIHKYFLLHCSQMPHTAGC